MDKETGGLPRRGVKSSGTGPVGLGGFVLPTGTVIGARYEVRGFLGAGGFAVVYRCWDLELRREVALKLLSRTSEEAASRLRREVALGSQWEHPHLLRLYEFGTHDGAPFCTMPVAEGGTLMQRLERGGPIPFGDAVRLAEELLEGLAYLHGKGFLHRDVKPSNVFFDGEGELRLGDFGIVLDPSATRYTIQGQTPGTPFYMAPEFITGHEPRPASDVWSAGLTVKDMLRGPDATRPTPPLPKWFARWLDGMCQQEPARRFLDAGAALEALQERLAPPHVKRRRKTMAAVAASLLVVTAGLGYAAYEVWKQGRAAVTLAAAGTTVRGLAQSGSPLWSAELSVPVQDTFPLLGPSGSADRFLVTCSEPTGPTSNLSPRPRAVLLSPQGQILSDTDLLARFNPFEKAFPHARYAIQLLALCDLNQDGYQDAVLKCLQAMYPCIVYVVSGKDGRCMGGFANSGHVHDVVPIPMKRLDRKPGGFFFIGVNNRMGHQAVVATGSADGFQVSPDLVSDVVPFDHAAYRPLGSWPTVDQIGTSLDEGGRLLVGSPSDRVTVTASGILSTDQGFGAPDAEGRMSRRVIGFYLSVLRARKFVLEGRSLEGQSLYRELIRQAPDPYLAFYAQIDGARVLREAGRPNLGLPLMPDEPARSPNPGSAFYQKADLLTLTGGYSEAMALYEQSVREPGINTWYGLPGYLQACVLGALPPSEIHRRALRFYPEQLNHPLVRAYCLLAGYLEAGAVPALQASEALSFQDSQVPAPTLEVILPHVGEVWTSFVESAAGRTTSKWPDEGAVALENDPVLVAQHSFVKAYRSHLSKEPGSLESMAASFAALKEASRREVISLVPFTVAAYTYGFAATEAGDRERGAEALRDGLRLYPGGPFAEKARRVLKRQR